MSSRHRFEIQFVFFCNVRSKLIGLFWFAWKMYVFNYHEVVCVVVVFVAAKFQFWIIMKVERLCFFTGFFNDIFGS